MPVDKPLRIRRHTATVWTGVWLREPGTRSLVYVSFKNFNDGDLSEVILCSKIHSLWKYSLSFINCRLDVHCVKLKALCRTINVFTSLLFALPGFFFASFCKIQTCSCISSLVLFSLCRNTLLCHLSSAVHMIKPHSEPALLLSTN